MQRPHYSWDRRHWKSQTQSGGTKPPIRGLADLTERRWALGLEGFGLVVLQWDVLLVPVVEMLLLWDGTG